MLELLEVLESFVKAFISNTKGGENIARFVPKSFFDIVVLEVKELFVGNGSFTSLPVEEGGVGSDQTISFGKLDVVEDT